MARFVSWPQQFGLWESELLRANNNRPVPCRSNPRLGRAKLLSMVRDNESLPNRANDPQHWAKHALVGEGPVPNRANDPQHWAKHALAGEGSAPDRANNPQCWAKHALAREGPAPNRANDPQCWAKYALAGEGSAPDRANDPQCWNTKRRVTWRLRDLHAHLPRVQFAGSWPSRRFATSCSKHPIRKP